MDGEKQSVERFLSGRQPFDLLPRHALDALIGALEGRRLDAGQSVFEAGARLDALYVIADGTVDMVSASGVPILRLGGGDLIGARELLRDGPAPNRAVTTSPVRLLALSKAVFLGLAAEHPDFATFFSRSQRGRAETPGDVDLTTLPVGEIMTRDPVTIGADASVGSAARLLRDRGISSLPVTTADGRLVGILTTGDLTCRVLAERCDDNVPVGEVMTPDPFSLAPSALGLHAFVAMAERGIGHLPVVDRGRLVGIVTRTTILRHQSLSAIYLIGDIASRETPAALAEVTARLPQLLAQLVGGGAEPQVVSRLVTSVTDAVTRRLIDLAEAELGPPPVPYLWLACGSQGRSEQTGVSDQDNCLILDNRVRPEHDGYFAALAQRVCAGLDACGYVYCPGDMMATTPRWRQPVATWRSYYAGWVRTPNPMAQMLASVMFDLRPIAGDETLYENLHTETLAMARANSIFVAHMVANSLKHQPPLSLFGGFWLIRDSDHRDTLDLKHSGVVPVVDLARVYALQGALTPVNTRERLIAAREAGVISPSGGHDLLDAYDLIAETRLRHQARLIREGRKPDNFMAPGLLSDLERNHLRSAFVIIKTMQSALAQGRHALV